MDLISHVLFAHLITGSTKISYELVIGSVFQDLDRLYSYPKKRMQRAESRTFFHELPFISLVILWAVVSGHILFVYGVISHIFLDFVTGHTRPFYPIVRDDIDFNLPFRAKIFLGVVIWVIGVITIRF